MRSSLDCQSFEKTNLKKVSILGLAFKRSGWLLQLLNDVNVSRWLEQIPVVLTASVKSRLQGGFFASFLR